MKQVYTALFSAMLQSLVCFSKNKSAASKRLVVISLAIVYISCANAQTLIAYYPLNGNAKDASGNHYDGTISGGVLFAADLNNNTRSAASFNGVDGRIDVPDKPAFRPQSFTVSTWFYLDATPSRYKTIVAKNLCNGVLESFAIYINSNGRLYGTISDGVNSTNVICDAPGLNSWHLATMTYDYTQGNLFFYLDGTALSLANTHLQIAYDSNSFAIGDQLKNCANDYFFHGKIDEVRLYNGALSGKQVSDLYDSATQKPATLIAYYPLNGNAKDSSGNHFDGTISGDFSFTADRNGKAYSAAAFNGLNSRIDVPDKLLLRPIDFSISAWFYFDKSPNGYKNIVTKNLCNGRIESFALQITPSNHIEGTASDAYTSIGVDGPIPSLYTWHLATMTFSQLRDSVKFYFDGVLTSVLKTSLNIEYDNSSLSIGDELENCANDYFFHGRIDEVRLYNGILTDKQVSDLYNSSSVAITDKNTATSKKLFNVSVFPNPVSSQLNIYISHASKEFDDTKNALNINSASLNVSKATLQITGIAGNMLISKEVDAFNKNMLQLNVSQLAPGTYFMKLIADGREASVVKFEKQ